MEDQASGNLLGWLGAVNTQKEGTVHTREPMTFDLYMLVECVHATSFCVYLFGAYDDLVGNV